MHKNMSQSMQVCNARWCLYVMCVPMKSKKPTNVYNTIFMCQCTWKRIYSRQLILPQQCPTLDHNSRLYFWLGHFIEHMTSICKQQQLRFYTQVLWTNAPKIQWKTRTMNLKCNPLTNWTIRSLGHFIEHVVYTLQNYIVHGSFNHRFPSSFQSTILWQSSNSNW